MNSKITDTNPSGEQRIYLQADVPVEEILKTADRLKNKRGNQGRKKKPTLIDMVCCFDIETTYLFA